jgi:hypothetical protein
MRDCPTDLPRRGLLRALLLAASAGLAAAEPLSAQTKMSKQDAEYQDTPKDIRMCATCTLFEAPQSCKVVGRRHQPEWLVQSVRTGGLVHGAAPHRSHRRASCQLVNRRQARYRV